MSNFSIILLLLNYENIPLCESLLLNFFSHLNILILYDSIYSIQHHKSISYQSIPYRYHSHSGIWYSSIQQHISTSISHLFCIEYQKPDDLISLNKVLHLFQNKKKHQFTNPTIFFYQEFFLYPSQLFFKYTFYQNEKINNIQFSQRVFRKLNILLYKIEDQQIFSVYHTRDDDQWFQQKNIYEKETTILYEISEDIYFDLEYVYHLLSLPIYKKDILILFDKKCKKKNQILEMLKPLLKKNENLYVIMDYPLRSPEDLKKEIYLFMQKRESIILFHPTSGFYIIENNIKEEKNYLYYESMNYIKLKMISDSFMSYQLYHQEMIDLKKNMNLKMNMHQQVYPFQSYQLLSFYPCYQNKEINIKVYIIHLKERYDRLGYMDEELKKEDFHNYHIWDGIKLKEEDIGIVNPELLLKKDKKYVKGAGGCKMAHLTLLKNHSESNTILIIFEDDFVWKRIPNLSMKRCIIEKIHELNEKDKDWTLLYIAMSQAKKKEKIQKKIEIIPCEENEGLSTVAYIVNPKKINIIIQIIEENGEEIDVIYQKYVSNRYRFFPNLGYQRRGMSDILGEWTNYEYQYEF